MKLLKEIGNFKILTPKSTLRQQLLNIERAGRTCYQSETGSVTEETARQFIQMLLKRGHESVIEHSSLTVKFTNVARGFTHELVRHRLGSFSQESTRYVDYSKGSDQPDLDAFECHFIAPPHRDPTEKVTMGDGRELSMKEMFREIEEYYRALRKAGWNPEDARQILPIGIQAQIVTTTNFRQWRHIFTLRTSKPAHWEIRGVLGKLLKRLQELTPGIFDDFKLAGKDTNGIEYFEKR